MSIQFILYSSARDIQTKRKTPWQTLQQISVGFFYKYSLVVKILHFMYLKFFLNIVIDQKNVIPIIVIKV